MFVSGYCQSKTGSQLPRVFNIHSNIFSKLREGSSIHVNDFLSVTNGSGHITVPLSYTAYDSVHDVSHFNGCTSIGSTLDCGSFQGSDRDVLEKENANWLMIKQDIVSGLNSTTAPPKALYYGQHMSLPNQNDGLGCSAATVTIEIQFSCCTQSLSNISNVQGRYNTIGNISGIATN